MVCCVRARLLAQTVEQLCEYTSVYVCLGAIHFELYFIVEELQRY